MSWTKKELIDYIRDIEDHRNKIRIINIKLDNHDLENTERLELIQKRDEIQNTLNQVEFCINNLDNEDKVIVVTNIKEKIPLKCLQLNYSLSYLKQKKNVILTNIIKTLNL